MNMKCPQCGRMIEVSPSELARLLASVKSPARAKASRMNGKKGGRPPKVTRHPA